jgi:hypothetical protein
VAKVEAEALSLARAHWQASGLTDEHAKKLRFRPLAANETTELNPKFHAVRALHIPYFDLSGKPTEFFRIRYLEKLPGFAGLAEKQQRYAQPAGTLNEAYFPPILDQSWTDIATDTSVTIHISEGEKKSSAACAHGLATIGLGGVDVWLSTKREIPMLPALAKIKWQNRQVVIIYDSDAASNPNVVRAQLKLAKELTSRGAHMSIASLPPAEKCRKGGKGSYCKEDLSCGCQGLDDFLVAEGEPALAEVLKNAPGFPESEALWELNEEIVYVLNPGFVVVKETGFKLDPNRFVAHAYANRHYMAGEATKDGNTVLKKKRLAPRWIEWEHRHELEAMTYAPGRPTVTDGRLNSWPGWGCAPIKGDIAPWHWLLDFIFKGFPESRTWFERWAAYPLQHPGVKMYSAPLIWGRAHGTGKTAMFYALMAIYGTNAIEIKNKHLRGGFNAWQENRQFVYGDEIEGNGDNSTKKIDSEWLKGLITQKAVTINQKFLPEYTIPDVMNYGFTSQKPDAVFMDDRDRRFMIHEVAGAPADRPFYERLDKWLNGDVPNSGKGPGPSHLFHHLLHLDLGDFSPRAHAPMTLAKRAMILNAKGDAGMWVVQLKEDPARMLAPLGEDASKHCDLFTPSQLFHAFDPDKRLKVAANTLGKELSNAEIRQVNGGATVRTGMGIVRLYAVRNSEQWEKATVKQILEHYNRFFGR